MKWIALTIVAIWALTIVAIWATETVKLAVRRHRLRQMRAAATPAVPAEAECSICFATIPAADIYCTHCLVARREARAIYARLERHA